MLTNKSLCVVLDSTLSELWTMASNKMHPCHFSLKLFVVTFVLTYTFYTHHFLSALRSSKSGISICTHGSRIKNSGERQHWTSIKRHTLRQSWGNICAKTEKWQNKPLTQRMLLLHPSAVPHLPRLQPPLGSASWIDGGQWACSLWSQWKWTQPCPQVLREHAEWHEVILLHFKANYQPERIPSECFSSWNRRRYRDITLRYMQPYLGEQEEEQLLQLAKWDKKFSAVYVIRCINILESSWKAWGV